MGLNVAWLGGFVKYFQMSLQWTENLVTKHADLSMLTPILYRTDTGPGKTPNKRVYTARKNSNFMGFAKCSYQFQIHSN